MSKVIVIHQPDFLPHAGFFHKLFLADLFVVLDDVQFLRRGWHHRDKIKTRQGESWLTLSVQKTSQTALIRDVQLSTDTAWIDSCLNLILENYRGAPYFEQFFSQLEAIFRAGHRRMIDLNMALLAWLQGELEIRVPHVLASSLSVAGSSNEKLINIVRSVEGTQYLTGSGSRSYLDEEKFAKAGIDVQWQQFEAPVYAQQFGPFIPNLSAMDMLLNCGSVESRRLIRAGTCVRGFRSSGDADV